MSGFRFFFERWRRVEGFEVRGFGVEGFGPCRKSDLSPRNSCSQRDLYYHDLDLAKVFLSGMSEAEKIFGFRVPLRN